MLKVVLMQVKNWTLRKLILVWIVAVAQVWIVNRAPGGPDKYDVDVRFIAFDRAKNSEVVFHQIDQDVFLVDPNARP